LLRAAFLQPARSKGRWGARGEREKERESNLLDLNRRRHPPSVPPRPSARRLAPRRGRVAPCARLAAGAHAAPPVVAASPWRNAGDSGAVWRPVASAAAWRALGRGGVDVRVMKLGVGGGVRRGGGTPSQPLRVVRRARCGRAPRRGHPREGVVASRQSPAWRCRAVGSASAEARCGASQSRGATAASSPPPPRGNNSRAVPRANR